MRTAAQDFAAQEQRKFPPPVSQTDVLAPLYGSLRPALPQELSAMVERGDVVLAEIGKVHPDVRTFFPRDGYAIEFTSGMLVYTELLARYCAATFVEGAVGSPALTLDDVKTLVASIIETYKKQAAAIWKKPDFAQKDIAITPAAAEFRDALLDCTRTFILAHEFGHVAMQAKLRPAVAPEDDELAADKIGLEFALPAGFEKHSARMAIAGAGMAIRLFVSLERFGVKFGAAYPPQEQRLAALQSAAGTLLGSDQRADEFSTVMVAILDLMDHLDNEIAGGNTAMTYTEQRARVGILARLIEVASGRLSPETVAAMIESYAAGLQRGELANVLNTLCSYYWDWIDMQGYFVAPQFLAKMTSFDMPRLVALSGALRALAAAMPESQRTLLDAKYAALLPSR